MELRLHLLETFQATGSDGASYKVCAYERMAPDLSAPAGQESWEPTGQSEYRLDDGRAVDVRQDGTMRIVGTDVTLTQPARTGATAASATSKSAAAEATTSSASA
jgi:hypothetical protein